MHYSRESFVRSTSHIVDLPPKMIDQSIARVRGVQRERRQLQMANGRASRAPPDCGRTHGFYPKTTQNRNRVFFPAPFSPPLLAHSLILHPSETHLPRKLFFFLLPLALPQCRPFFYVNTTRTRPIDKLSGFDDHVRFIAALPPGEYPLSSAL